MIVETDKNSFDFNQFRLIRDRSVGRLFWRLKRFTSNFIEPRLQAMGYTDFKMSYLMFLSNIEEHGITNNELAKRACVTKQMMSKIVGLLEEEGYIYTQKNPNDSRSSIIFLNERGKELFVALEECMQEVRSKFNSIVGADRMEQVIETMSQLVNTLEQDEQ
ncbi:MULTISPECIES: MarR family winged helix-turn-helix transcriptional regulator [Spirosoma]|uniref:MarR family transcriptional regulator n=1 Tax=Spirosoma liriopis TaxID=2937440 RepID=A0ABT0HJU1_9BACT|nr:MULTISPECIES: MarR family transcriptional regulator [Spirosoma]MCK8492396.1 MarR family transcriptional regulator [Spirosoma liriopis]UHG91869.1 MarR family transcriptional regulator [Spirosoma oryzicola]